MKLKTLPLFLSLIAFYFTLANATIFTIRNNCQYPVWPAAALGDDGNAMRVDLGGSGMRLDPGGVWNLNVNPGATGTRIWARTNCLFDEAGNGKCETSDCEGRLECKGFGQPPNTMAECALNQFDNLDFFDISLVDGFNVPVEFIPNSKNCTGGIRCSADITRQCPNELKAPGGCNNPCTVFKTDQYCCNSGSCGPTDFSKFFKDRYPDAYSYPQDDPTSTFTCPGGTNYRVVFCP